MTTITETAPTAQQLRIKELYAILEDTTKAIRFWKREAYLAKSPSRYVKRSEYETIEATIEKLDQVEIETFDLLDAIRKENGFSWDDIFELVEE